MVNENSSLKLVPGASVAPDVDVVDVVPDVLPRSARTVATTTSAHRARRRLANFDLMVFSSRCRILTRELYTSLRACCIPVFPAEWSSQQAQGHHYRRL